MKELKDIGKRLQEVKNRFNLVNEELGEICGVSYAAIGNIINGITKDPGVSLFVKLSEKLEINIEWLLFGRGEMLRKDMKADTKNHPESVNYLKAENKNLKIIIEAKEGENKVLRKMVDMLEEKIFNSGSKRQAS